jgi:glutaminase
MPAPPTPPLPPDLDTLLREVAGSRRPRARDGEVADYIEPLASVDPGASRSLPSNRRQRARRRRRADDVLPIQSISKVFALVLAMQKADAAEGVAEELWRRVGVEPSGDPFNSLVQLEHERGIPRNPMINAGRPDGARRAARPLRRPAGRPRRPAERPRG